MKGARKLLRYVFAITVMLCTFIVPVFADSQANEQVKDARKGVFTVELWYEDGKGYSEYCGGGSAFLINDDTIVTCYHVVHIDQYENNYSWVLENIPNFDIKNMKIKVVVRNDVRIEAKILQESEMADFAILKLDQPISNRTVLKLAKPEPSETELVFAMGFPDSVTVFQNKNSYTFEDVTISDGRVTKTNESDGIKYVQHSATLSSGYSGGPLVNYAGEVIAINRGTLSENNYSVAISEVTAVLDDIGIEYTVGDGTVGSTTEQTTESVTSETESIAENSSEEAVETTAAPEVTTNETISVEKPTVSDNATDEKKGGLDSATIIVIVIIAVVVILMVVILVINLGGKNKGSNSSSAGITGMSSMPDSDPGPSSWSAPSPGQISGGGVSPTMFEGAGETEFVTTLLDDGGSETSFLSNNNMMPPKNIMRIKTNETIKIDRAEFVIGKERRKVNYCVSGNSSVSRTHARFINRNGELYVVDLNTTNGTYVNGIKVNPNQEVKLSSGDIVKLSDEEFRVM